MLSREAMKRSTPMKAALVALALFVVPALVSPAAAEDGSAKQPDAPACVQWRTEVRYANYGYDHWVIIHNGCERRAVCVVSTDVNPRPIHVAVPAGRTKQVLTFRGSPAREFRAHVVCRLHG
jgi:hypothetical protein